MSSEHLYYITRFVQTLFHKKRRNARRLAVQVRIENCGIFSNSPSLSAD